MRNGKTVWVSVGLLGVGLATWTLAGCGGSSSPATSSGNSGQSIRLFVTDSFREDVDQVFLTIVKVELIGQDGSVVTAYDDPVGHQFDAKSLRDDTGQIYNFLAASNIPSRLYTAVRVTLAGGFTIAPKDALLTKTLPVDESFPRDEQGRTQIQYALTTPRDLSANEGNLVIDVDLANFRYNGSAIIPAFADSSADGLGDLSRHQNDEYRGVITNLSGNQFELTLGNTRNLPVTLAPDAVLFGDGGTDRSGLVSGQTVEAVGKLDIVTGRFLAAEIRSIPLADGEAEPARPQVNGTVVQSNQAGDLGTISLRIARLKGFRPVQTTVQIETSETATTFIARDGSNITGAAFYAALATNPRLYVEGTFDAATNEFTASLAKLE